MAETVAVLGRVATTAKLLIGPKSDNTQVSFSSVGPPGRCPSAAHFLQPFKVNKSRVCVGMSAQ